MKTQKRYTMRELSSLTGMTPRTIRFYIQEGLVEKPEGQARGAYYTDRHLRQLLTVKKYRDSGVSLERIAQILREERDPGLPLSRPRPGTVEVISRIHLADGVELLVDPERSGLDRSQIRRLCDEVSETIAKMRKEKEKDSK